jgi:hypothetical protein
MLCYLAWHIRQGSGSCSRAVAELTQNTPLLPQAQDFPFLRNFP